MANLYSAGYGEDGPAAYNQQMTTAADQAPSQVPAGVSPYAQQAQRAQRRQGQSGQQWGQQRRRMGGMGQPTFRQMQASGQARPAPPPPEQQWTSGVDGPTDPAQALTAAQSTQQAPQTQQMQQVQQVQAPRPVLTSAPDPQRYQDQLAQMAGLQQQMLSQGAAPPDMQVAGYAPQQMQSMAAPSYAPTSGGNTFATMAMDLQNQMQNAQGFDAPMAAQEMSAAPMMASAAPMPSSPAAAPSGVGTAPQFTGDIKDYIGQALNNPGGYSFDETKKLYDRLGQNIDDEFTGREQALKEEMAARGLSDSSIYGGRSQDLNVGRRQARQDLLQNLGSQQAQALFGQQTGFLDRLLGLRSQDQQAGYQAGQLGVQQGQLALGQAELNRALMNDQDRMMLALLGVGDF